MTTLDPTPVATTQAATTPAATTPAATTPADTTTLDIAASLDVIEATIGELVARMVLPADRGRGRPRILPAMALWGGLVVCVARGFSSQLALWRLLSKGGLWGLPRYLISDQAVYKRLATAGSAPLIELFERLTDLLQKRLAALIDGKPDGKPGTLAAFASGVVAIDETTLDKVARVLPTLRDVPDGDRRLLPGKLGGVFDLRLGIWRRIIYHAQEPSRNEKRGARELVATLARGTLIVADLGYFGFAWFDWLTDHGYWWVSRQRAKTSTRVIHCFYRGQYQGAEVFDGLVWLGAYRADRAAHAVRLVRFRVGGVTHDYLTNVLDPLVFSLEEIARVYARRWDIELGFKLVKRELGLHMIWSAKTAVIELQVWATLIIAQILGGLRQEAAARAEVEVEDVSIALMVQALPEYAAAGQDPIAAFVADGRLLGYIRPARRIRLDLPSIPPEEIVPLPPDTVLIRTARHSDCDHGPRTPTTPHDEN